MTLINHNSFLMIVLFILAITIIVLRQRGWEMRSWLILGGLTIVLATGYFSLRPSPAASEEAEEVWAQVGQGVPVLLELQSQN